MKTVTNSFFCTSDVYYDETEYRDIDVNIVKNNPIEHLSSYNAHVIYKSSDYKKTDIFFNCWDIMFSYSMQTEIDKALEQMRLRRFGAPWEHLSWEDSKQVEIFMSILMKRDVICTAIVKCHYDDGYPYWIVYLH